MSDRTIQKLFSTYREPLRASKQPLKNRKAIHALTHCRTRELGVSYYACKDNHVGVEVPHSCRHRSCFLCAQKKRLEWIEKQKTRLLDVPHFHVIFTLPHEYLSVWRYNEALFSRIIFQASQKTLLTLLGDERHGGVRPGIMSALHTWGRQLNLHPHVHCLVTAGGVTRQGRWKGLGHFLLPSKVIRTVYRGTLQGMVKAAFESGELQLPPDLTVTGFWATYRSLYRKSWSVRIEERYEHGKGVLLYLARYCKGGPVNPAQLTSVTSEAVELRYLDHRDRRLKTQRLKPMDFMRRLLQHVPPGGVHTFRYYGLYAPAAKRSYEVGLEACGNLACQPDRADRLTMVLYCKACGGVTRRKYQWWPRRLKGISINKEGLRYRASGHMQQDDERLVAESSFDTS